jgi:hypothetical protein
MNLLADARAIARDVARTQGVPLRGVRLVGALGNVKNVEVSVGDPPETMQHDVPINLDEYDANPARRKEIEDEIRGFYEDSVQAWLTKHETRIDRLARTRPQLIVAGLVAAGVFHLLVLLLLTYGCWVVGSNLWTIAPKNTGYPSLWQLLAIFVTAVAVVIAVGIFGGSTVVTAPLLNAYTKIAEAPVSKALDERQEAQKEAEQHLACKDTIGLVPLIGYSQQQLDSYYKIGLRQARNSFAYGVTAMWIGFAIFVIGMTLPMFVPAGRKPAFDIRTITIAMGSTTEFISALFLWLYRSSMKQLTYFYDRQIYTHNILLGHRIAEAMQDKGKSDETSALMVKNLLEHVWAAEQPALPTKPGRTNPETTTGQKSDRSSRLPGRRPPHR